MDYVTNPSFGSEVEALMRQYHVPGLSLAVVQDDQVFSEGYGNACLETAMPCTADTVFDIASCAKSMTAASVALLVDDNQDYADVQYHATMSHLLPDDFVMSTSEHTAGVTVEDVLSHRTGMAPHDNSYFGTNSETPDTACSITRNLRNLAVAAPIRSRYLYCNVMYTAATHLVEVKTQQPFCEFLDQRLFHPLGMNSSCLQPGNARSKGFGDRIATGYVWDKETEYRGLQSSDCPEGQGAGSVMSSANDMTRWVKALIDQEGPITPAVYRGLLKLRSFPYQHSARIKPHTSPVIYAAGLDVYYYRGYMFAGHNGVIPGFASRFVFSPDLRFGAVIMGNASGAGSISTTLFRKLIDEVLGVSGMEVPVALKSKDKPNPQQNLRNDGKKKEKPQKAHSQEHQKKKEKKGRQDKKTDERNKDVEQERPLELYTGKYWNAGYRWMEVEIKDDQLFVDATNRSMGFTLRFRHVRDQTKYTACLTDAVEGGSDPVEAEFLFQDKHVLQMGLRLEETIPGLIWFEKMVDR